MLLKSLLGVGGAAALGGIALVATPRERAAVTASATQAAPATRGAPRSAFADTVARDAPPAAVSGALVLGAQTHFSQSWPAAWLGLADEIHATALRDGMPWPSGERQPGQYALPTNAAVPITALCRRGGDVVLTIEPRNKLYDDGMTVSSEAGIRAYASYVAAVVGTLGDRCVAAVEVGNEINNPRNLPYPAGTAMPDRYVALVRATRDAMRAKGFRTAILGGSTNTIGTGFLATLFKAGLLDAADGIAVHPYRRHAEGIEGELAHLNGVMARFGRPLPIWATEFSDPTPDAQDPAGELVKMTTLMSAAGVARAYWYALIDQRAFPTLGLFTQARTRKPAGDAFAMVQDRLAKAGRAERVDTGDATVRLYRFAGNRYVLWGAGGRMTFAGRTVVRDARGGVVPASGAVAVTGTPLLIEGATGYTLERGGVLADSLLGYGAAPWSYRVSFADGRTAPIDWFDWGFDSYRSARAIRPAWIGNSGGTPAGDAAHAIRPVLRYTAPVRGAVSLAACINKGRRRAPGVADPLEGSDGIDVTVLVDGKPVRREIVTDRTILSGIDANLAAGGTIDLVFGPNQTQGHDSFSYRARILKRGAGGEPPCP